MPFPVILKTAKVLERHGLLAPVR
ncbi:hypothetical protein ACQPTN_35655 [Bradyrhizobium sp. 13971]